MVGMGRPFAHLLPEQQPIPVEPGNHEATLQAVLLGVGVTIIVAIVLFLMGRSDAWSSDWGDNPRPVWLRYWGIAAVAVGVAAMFATRLLIAVVALESRLTRLVELQERHLARK
jgi:hypothetical protein